MTGGPEVVGDQGKGGFLVPSTGKFVLLTHGSSTKIRLLAPPTALRESPPDAVGRCSGTSSVNAKIPILIGSVLFACLVLLVVPRHVRSIESDIAQRTEAVLARQGLAARIAVDGRDVTLSGNVSSGAMRTQAIEVVGDLWGVRSVADRMAADERERLAALSPPTSARPEAGSKPAAAVAKAAPPSIRVHVELSAARDLKLSGQAPSAATKEAWLAKALSFEYPGALQDRLSVVDADDSERIELAVLEGLAELDRLEEGRLSATESRLRISGRGRAEGIEDEIEQRLLSALPRGYRVSVDVHTPRSADRRGGAGANSVMRLHLSRGRDNAVIVSGVAPGETLKAEWLALAVEQYTVDRVRDRLTVLEVDPPEHYGECLQRALPWIDKLTNGRIEISPGLARVFGNAGTARDAERLQADLVAAGCSVDVARLGVRNAGS